MRWRSSLRPGMPSSTQFSFCQRGLDGAPSVAALTDAACGVWRRWFKRGERSRPTGATLAPCTSVQGQPTTARKDNGPIARKRGVGVARVRIPLTDRRRRASDRAPARLAPHVHTVTHALTHHAQGRPCCAPTKQFHHPVRGSWWVEGEPRVLPGLARRSPATRCTATTKRQQAAHPAQLSSSM